MNLLPQLFHVLRGLLVSLTAAFLRCGLVLLIAVLCLIVTPALAKTYSDNGDGTVTDPTTGLTWMRCVMGQTWDGSTCTGSASTYTYHQANALTGTVTFARQSDWRLPNIRELQAIAERSNYIPAIDEAVFPNTPSSYFLTSTPAANNVNAAWIVTFFDGAVSTYYIGDTGHVRLVRNGLSSALLNEARPSSDYVDHGDGTVSHTPTGLTWKRCVEGQTWTGTTCAGGEYTLTWEAAKAVTSTFAGKSDWRLPAADELGSLIDYTLAYPPLINSALFPSTPIAGFWSSSLYGNAGNSAWAVFFNDGQLGVNIYFSRNAVRLVRGGQPSTLASLSVTLSGNGSGAVTSSPAGINCGGTCDANYTRGTSVTLSATPASGSTFIGWGGSCTGEGSCVVSMTTAQSLKAIFDPVSSVNQNFNSSWILAGNGTVAPIDVASAFGDAAKFATVWKWIAPNSRWAFYAPSLIGQALTDYAAAKGYDVLATIAAGEGFWVNAKQVTSVALPTGNPISLAALSPTLVQGWNLSAIGETATPKQFCDAQSTGVTTLWAWDSTNSAWYFYAPSLDANGSLSSYITSKGYLDFTTAGKTLGQGVGFWINKP